MRRSAVRAGPKPTPQAPRMLIPPYLFFDGRGEEAVRFYSAAPGAEIEILVRFRESPDPPPPGVLPADWGDKLMHGSLKNGALRLMLSDGCGDDGGRPSGFALSLDVVEAEAIDRTLDALARDGGEITMPAGPTFWCPRFGSARDRFGVQWMVGLAEAADAPSA